MRAAPAWLKSYAGVLLLIALVIGPLFIIRPPAPNRCYLLWDRCFDTPELLTQWAWSHALREVCGREAEKIIGEKLSWPPQKFTTYYTLQTFKSGTLTLIERKTLIPLECHIDLHERVVTSVKRLDRVPQ